MDDTSQDNFEAGLFPQGSRRKLANESNSQAQEIIQEICSSHKRKFPKMKFNNE